MAWILEFHSKSTGIYSSRTAVDNISIVGVYSVVCYRKYNSRSSYKPFLEGLIDTSTTRPDSVEGSGSILNMPVVNRATINILVGTGSAATSSSETLDLSGGDYTSCTVVKLYSWYYVVY